VAYKTAKFNSELRSGIAEVLQQFSIAMTLAVAAWLGTGAPPAQAAPCLIVTLTGTTGGPPVINGLAGAGTLVRYGDDADNCGALNLQFDSGRDTAMRLSQLGVTPGQLNAIFFTHMHSDHTEGFADIMLARWIVEPSRPKIDLVCSADSVSPLGIKISCKNFVQHFADAFLQSGEIAQRSNEGIAGPGGPTDLTNVITFEPNNEPQLIWSSGDVKVGAIRSNHIAGHASYRVDTPAGSVVIGGDATNDKVAPPRSASTSDQVEKLAKGADVIVHSTIHPVMGPDEGSGFPAPVFYRQSSASDLGAMAKRTGAKHLMLTHLIPPLGVGRAGPFSIPGGPLAEADYRKAVEETGFAGDIVVGTDLVSVRLPPK
jgi:ribonuclease Z